MSGEDGTPDAVAASREEEDGTGASASAHLPRLELVFQTKPGSGAPGVAGLDWRVITTVTGTDGATTRSTSTGETGSDGVVAFDFNPVASSVVLELLSGPHVEVPDPPPTPRPAVPDVWASYDVRQETTAPSSANEHGVAKRLSMLGYSRGVASASDLREAIVHYLANLTASASPGSLNDHFDPSSSAALSPQALFDSLLEHTPR